MREGFEQSSITKSITYINALIPISKIQTTKYTENACITQRLEYCAEREGFEPPEVLPSTVFKTASLNRSDISPGQRYDFF